MKWDISLDNWHQPCLVCPLLGHLQFGHWQSRERHSSPRCCVSAAQQRLKHECVIIQESFWPQDVSGWNFVHNLCVWVAFTQKFNRDESTKPPHCPYSALIFYAVLKLTTVLWHLWDCLLPALFILSLLHLSASLEDGTTGKATWLNQVQPTENDNSCHLLWVYQVWMRHAPVLWGEEPTRFDGFYAFWMLFILVTDEKLGHSYACAARQTA